MRYLIVAVTCLLFAGCHNTEAIKARHDAILEKARIDAAVREQIKQDGKTERAKLRNDVWGRLPFLKEKE